MACPTQIYHGITAEVFNCLTSTLEQAGISVPPGNSGTISGRGVTANFDWNEEAAILTITVTRKPFIVSCGYVNKKLHNFVQGCGGQ